MLRIRTSAALTTGLVASLLIATPTTGQEAAPDGPAPTASVDPTRGAAGDEVTVRGTGCRHEETGQLGQLTFGFQTKLDESDTTLDPVVDIRVGPTGSWVSTVAIPERIRINGELTDIVPGDDYSITALCVFEELPSWTWIPYDAMPFEVTAGPGTVTPPGESDTAAPAPGPGGPTSPTGASSTGAATSTPSPAVPIHGDPQTTG